eukprot:738949_1
MGSIQNTCCGSSQHTKKAKRNKNRENMTKFSILNKTKSNSSTIINILSPAPLRMESMSNSLHEDEKNISTDRIDSLKAMSEKSATDIRQKVFEQYSTPKGILSEEDEEFESESEFSELSSDGREEIAIRKKSISNSNSNKSQLYRQRTRTRWSQKALGDMEDEMEKQMEMLRKQSATFSNKSNKSNNSNKSDGNVNKDINGIEKQSSLFRYKSSYKWDVEDVETNKKEMQEQIVFLLQTHQQSGLKEDNKL